jgi:rhamnogalacturonyl hydrolase YesR
MNKWIRLLGIVFNLPSFLLTASAQPSDAEILRRVAGHVINNTTYDFVDEVTGETFDSTEGLAVNGNIKIRSQYNYWQYPNGVIHHAMMELHDFLGDEHYRDYPIANYDFFFANTDFLKRMYDAGHRKWDFHLFFRMFKLDDCGALAAGLIDVLPYDSRPAYVDYIKRTAQLAMEERYRLEDGTWAKRNPYDATIWLDDLYMGVPFLAKMGQWTGEDKYFDFAVKQVLQFDSYLYEPANGLYYHNYYTDLGRPGIAHWSRANGWCILAKIGLLEHLPEDHSGRAAILKSLDRQVVGLSRHQSGSGLWRQLLDKADSYEETSGSAMFTYAIAKGVNEGWLDYRYYRVALEGWRGLLTQIDKNGAILGVCEQTPTSDDLVFYYNKPTPYNEFHGTGALILAGIEIIKLKEQRRILRESANRN